MKIDKLVPLQVVRSDKDTHFTGAISQNAKEDENITGLDCNSGLITGITIVSDQNLAWDVYLWGTDGFDDSDLDAENFLGRFSFLSSDGDQLGGSGQYYYSTSHASQSFQPIPYADADNGNELHISLVNRSASAKNAGATGEVVVTVHYAPDARAE